MLKFNILRSFYVNAKALEAGKPYKTCGIGFKDMSEIDAKIILAKLNTPVLCIDRVVKVN